MKTDKIKSDGIVEWALGKNIDVPEDLIRASGAAHKRLKVWLYTTPCLEAIHWVVDNYWEAVNPEDVPRQDEMLDLISDQFPKLSNHECLMVDRVTRDPSQKKGRRKG